MCCSGMSVDFIGHVCFRFVSEQGRVLITDPFFAEGFTWMGHWEKYLSRPDVAVEDIRMCDAVFVSHEHGDHFDPDAIRTILSQTDAVVVAPACVCETLAGAGMNEARLQVAAEAETFAFGDLALTTYTGYDNGVDDQGRPDKFALVVESGETRLFYSGDCHELPAAVAGAKVDAMFCWPELVDEKLKALCDGLDTDTFVHMHCDRFDPGLFLCNLDWQEQKRRVEGLVPGMTAIVPDRVKALKTRGG